MIPYVLKRYRFLDLEGQLCLKLVLLIELAQDCLSIEVDFIVWVLKHSLIELLEGPDHSSQLLREMSRGVLGFNHHKVVGLEIDLENEDEPHLALSWKELDSVLHQDIFFRLLSGCLLRIRAHPLNYDLHLQVFN